MSVIYFDKWLKKWMIDVDRFVIRLQRQAKRCQFEDQERENVKDQVIAGCRASLEEILKICSILLIKKKMFCSRNSFKALEYVNKINSGTWKYRESMKDDQRDCHCCG